MTPRVHHHIVTTATAAAIANTTAAATTASAAAATATTALAVATTTTATALVLVLAVTTRPFAPTHRVTSDEWFVWRVTITVRRTTVASDVVIAITPSSITPSSITAFSLLPRIKTSRLAMRGGHPLIQRPLRRAALTLHRLLRLVKVSHQQHHTQRIL
jgi:hypothetical protein